MQNPNEFDPYQPPVSTDPAETGVPKSEAAGYLKDPGFRGRVALIAISIQVLLKFILAFTTTQSDWFAVLTIAVVLWLIFIVSNIIQRFSYEPAMFGLWALAIGVSWGCVVVLVTRISRCQARFRRPDEPPRVRMTPLSRPQGSKLQPLQFRKIEQ